MKKAWWFLGMGLLVMELVLVGCAPSEPSAVDIRAQDVEVRARAAAENPYESFRAVINDCSMCGTDDLYGAWDTEDGRTLALNRSGTYVALFEDGTSMRGDWTLGGGELCLSPESGDRTCFHHEQRIDAMMLDDALYIRQ